VSARKETAAIHVWKDQLDSSGNYSASYYSVSRVDDDGDEIVCEGGDESLAEAWKFGCRLADQYGVPCVEFARETGEETDRYTPAEAAEA
jgi:hypothetical protein